MRLNVCQKMQNERNEGDPSQENKMRKRRTTWSSGSERRMRQRPDELLSFLTNGGRTTGDGSSRFIACLTPAATE